MAVPITSAWNYLKKAFGLLGLGQVKVSEGLERASLKFVDMDADGRTDL